MTMAELNALYNNMNVYENTVAPMAVNDPAGLQTINIAQAPMVQPVTQSNGLDYLLNQGGEQNQNLTVEEYNNLVNAPKKEPTDNFLTRALSGIADNKYMQGARNIGSTITDPLMGGLGYLAKKVDKFSSLPYVDQQYVKENMVYQDPSSGLYKDPYGKNVRSLGLFSDTDGSYGEVQIKERNRYKSGLEKAAEKYGVNIEFDKEGAYKLTGKKEDTEKERKEKIELMTKRTKNIAGAYDFYYGGAQKFETKKDKTNKIIMDKAKNERRAKQLIAQEAEAKAKALENAKRIGRRPTAPTFTPQGGGGQQAVSDSGGPTGGYSYDSGGRQGFGYGLKDGGRTGYGTGGIVTL